MTEQSQPRQYYAINRISDKRAEVVIYGEIGSGPLSNGITAAGFMQELAAVGRVDAIDVRINSPGGSVFEGLAIFNALRRQQATVHVHIDGIAASMASVIAMAGDRVTIASNAMMMIHDPRSYGGGKADDLRSAADMLDRARASILAAYLDRTSLTADRLSDMMSDETWFSADEAVLYGFADDIAAPVRLAASYLEELPHFLKVPVAMSCKFTDLLKGDPMPSETNPSPATPIAASVQELKALPYATPEFIVAQLEANATLDDAKTDLVATLAAKLSEHEATIAALQQEIDELRAKRPTIAKEPEVVPTTVGVEPVNSSSINSEGNSQPTLRDATAEYNREIEKLVDSGMTISAATAKLRATRGDLIAAIRAAS